MNPRFLSTLRQRLALLLVAVLIPAILLVIVNAFAARSRNRTEVQQDAYRLARLAAATHERLAETTEQLFATLSRIPAVTTGEGAGCRAAMAAVVEAGRRFQNLGVVDRSGVVRCTAGAMPGGARAPGGSWLAQAAGDVRLAVGRYEVTPLAERPTAILAQRVIHPAGEDIFFAALDLPWLSDLVGNASLPAEAAVNIVDDEGTILARQPDNAMWVGRNVGDSAIVARALAEGDGVAEGEGVDGIRRLYGFHRLAMPGGGGFTVTVGLPLDVAYAADNARLRLELGVLAGVAVVTLLAGRYAGERLFSRKIDALLRAARRLSAGDLTARTEARWTDDELGELARTFDAMAWTVSQRTDEMRQMMESLRALAARLESVREEERTRISREIHDELGQTLTGIRMDLDRLEERVDAAALPDATRAPITAKLASVRGLVDSGLDTARRISRQLRPSVLDVLGLLAGIEWQLEEFEARTRISTDLLTDADVSGLDEETSIALFRILQEALTNVMRHADATAVTVRLAREDEFVVMEVMDNGRGFTPPERPYAVSLGLLGMRERAASLGGSTVVTSAPGRGTTVHVRVPLDRASRGQP